MGFQWIIPAAKMAYDYLSNSGGSGTDDLERAIKDISRSPFASKEVQQLLPPYLRRGATGPMLQSGMQGIGQMLTSPGKLSGTVAPALLPQQAMQSDAIARASHGTMANRMGAAGASNLPANIRMAIMSMLQGGQAGAQRGVQGQALTQSDALRKQDLMHTYKIYDAILQYLSSARGQAIEGLAGAAPAQMNKEAANTAAVGAGIQALANILSGVGTNGGGSGSSNGWYGDTLM